MSVTRCVASVLAALTSGFASVVSAQSAPATAGATYVDSVVRAALSGGRVAGMTVAVVRGRDTVVLKGYGLADVELGVPTPDDAVYEVGSLTKQFTAAAILQLSEQGKLSLDDEITKYVPEYSHRGESITLRRLLNHTAGVFDYVALNAFLRLSRVPISHDSLVALFRDKPLDFAPGTAMAYSNSGYILLGLVIERVSGQPFDVYVQQHLFDRAGMRSAAYCSTSRIVPRRAHGYEVAQDGLRLAYYTDFSWIYAAGALCMTARDLVRWTGALHGGRILGPVAYQELITPDTLADGLRLRYASGVAVDSILGHRAVHHGGDLSGFTSEVTHLANDSLTVVVLMNTQGPIRPDELTIAILRGFVHDRAAPAAPFRGSVRDYVGLYHGVRQFQGVRTSRTFRVGADSTGRALTLQVDTGPVRSLAYYGRDTFGRGDTRFTFLRAGGRVTALHVDDVYSALVATR